MRYALSRLAALAVMIIVGSSVSGHAIPLDTGIVSGPKDAYDRTRLVEGSPTLAPFAFIVYCRNNPRDCRGGGAATVDLDRRAKFRLALINRYVNRAIAPKYDTGDVWKADVRTGDCEDYVLTKRRHLMRMGFPPAALRIAVARTVGGTGHAVLVVRTSKGDMVLDNRSNVIRPWNETDLTWIKIQSAENPKLWRAL